MTSATGTPKKREVLDTKGSAYELKDEISRGGQGIVYHTHIPQVLIKGFVNKDEQARQRWRKHISWLIQQDLGGLKLAKPLVMLAEPRCGYVMELMDGLVSLQSILDGFIEAGEEASSKYLQQGGMRRRVRILCQLARTLNQLHGRGMLYGDVSPSNVFVSSDPLHAETWLIDCDNISLEAHSGLTLYTSDYGAPEVVRGAAQLSSLTDVWSFAVIAYQLLTHNHPFKGELVGNGEPELEEAALRGLHPWINDSQIDTNVCFSNIPIELTEHSRLPDLFRRCFEEGKERACERPGMAEWLEALCELDDRFFDCTSCGSSNLLPVELNSIDDAVCFFCDSPADPKLVLFEEYIALPEENQSEVMSSWVATGRKVWLQPGGNRELKRLMPTFNYDRWPSDHIRIDYTDKGLGIHPLAKGNLHLQRGNTKKLLERYQGLKEELRGQHAEPYQIHVGELDESHIVWQFRW